MPQRVKSFIVLRRRRAKLRRRRTSERASERGRLIIVVFVVVELVGRVSSGGTQVELANRERRLEGTLFELRAVRRRRVVVGLKFGREVVNGVCGLRAEWLVWTQTFTQTIGCVPRRGRRVREFRCFSLIFSSKQMKHVFATILRTFFL